MHVRQRAWLASQPEKMKGYNRLGWLTAHRGEAVAAAFDVPPGPLAWLVDLLDDAGTCRVEVGGMGGALLLPLGWRELHYWMEGAGERSLSPTFRRAILALSAAHARAATAAAELECEAPFDPGADG